MTEPLLDILRVDDDRDDLALLSIAVDKSDLNICLQTALNGQEAIDYLEGRGPYADRLLHPIPDLVVLDLGMPGVSGFDFLAWRNTSASFSQLPVIVFTGSHDGATIQKAYAMGADKCLVKPGDFENWRAVVREIWDYGLERRGV